jgi:hypothetical protein
VTRKLSVSLVVRFSCAVSAVQRNAAVRKQLPRSCKIVLFNVPEPQQQQHWSHPGSRACSATGVPPCAYQCSTPEQERGGGEKRIEGDHQGSETVGSTRRPSTSFPLILSPNTWEDCASSGQAQQNRNTVLTTTCHLAVRMASDVRQG